MAGDDLLDGALNLDLGVAEEVLRGELDGIAVDMQGALESLAVLDNVGSGGGIVGGAPALDASVTPASRA